MTIYERQIQMLLSALWNFDKGFNTQPCTMLSLQNNKYIISIFVFVYYYFRFNKRASVLKTSELIRWWYCIIGCAVLGLGTVFKNLFKILKLKSAVCRRVWTYTEKDVRITQQWVAEKFLSAVIRILFDVERFLLL